MRSRPTRNRRTESSTSGVRVFAPEIRAIGAARRRRGRMIPRLPGFAVLVLAFGAGCAQQLSPDPPKTLSRIAQVDEARVIRSFPADGVSAVVLRASQAEAAVVMIQDGPAQAVQVSGVPAGGAGGYHPADPTWRETPAVKWGLDFVTQRYDATLVISTTREIHYIHHFYVLKDIQIRVPHGIRVVREKRMLSGNGAPELQKP